MGEVGPGYFVPPQQQNNPGQLQRQESDYSLHLKGSAALLQ
jgi:hypothetical protein